MSIIDLGGGLGTLRTMASDDYGKHPADMWTVCDSSVAMMTSGSAFQLQEQKPTYFVQADIQNPLPFESNSFDIVFCINFLYLFPDRMHTTYIAPEITRVLRTHGVLIAITPKPKANNMKIIIDEVSLRSKNNRFSVLSVLKDILIHVRFLSSQGKIVTMANKKSPEDWAALYSAATHKKLEPRLCTLTHSYGGQAGLWVLQKQHT
jgi:ubiquinone/menaquinone biosynthesis C-methylase UbiE